MNKPDWRFSIIPFMDLCGSIRYAHELDTNITTTYVHELYYKHYTRIIINKIYFNENKRDI